MKTRPRTRWTLDLAIKFTIYLIVLSGLIALVPTFREILGFLLHAAGIVVAGGTGVFLALLLVGGLQAPRR